MIKQLKFANTKDILVKTHDEGGTEKVQRLVTSAREDNECEKSYWSCTMDNKGGNGAFLSLVPLEATTYNSV